jgi:hypothetical protein
LEPYGVAGHLTARIEKLFSHGLILLVEEERRNAVHDQDCPPFVEVGVAGNNRSDGLARRALVARAGASAASAMSGGANIAVQHGQDRVNAFKEYKASKCVVAARAFASRGRGSSRIR